MYLFIVVGGWGESVNKLVPEMHAMKILDGSYFKKKFWVCKFFNTIFLPDLLCEVHANQHDVWVFPTIYVPWISFPRNFNLHSLNALYLISIGFWSTFCSFFAGCQDKVPQQSFHDHQ